MTEIKLGSTNITTEQMAFGALPVQRADTETAVRILRRAFDGGMRFFDTARAYTDSEEKLGIAFDGMRDKIIIATKTAASTPDDFRRDLETSLRTLRTDYIDIYQFHNPSRCYKPDDGTGMYECMLEAKREGKIRHIGFTNHLLNVANECVDSGLYETLQFPFSYLADEKDIALVNKCRNANVGFIAMKALAGGLITNAAAAAAYMNQFDNVLPIWGIQRECELEQFLEFIKNPPVMTNELSAVIEKDRTELVGEFCRGCGYCMPCPQNIVINQCARISLMLRRAPSAGWVNEESQAMMKQVETCIECGLCSSRCPYGLDTPALLKRNYEDYKRVIAGDVSVDYKK